MTPKALVEPALKEAKKVIQDYFTKSTPQVMQIIGLGTVKYQGRAISNLQTGERLIIFKPDGTLLIHTHSKAKPVNWQNPGANFAVKATEDTLILSSHRTKPQEEIVLIELTKLSLLTVATLRDDAQLDLTGTEKQIQEHLFKHPEIIEKGFQPRKRERNASVGFYDIDGDDAHGHRVIVEVKRATAGVKEAQQLWRYVSEHRTTYPTMRGILIAERVSDKARKLLSSKNLEWQELDWKAILLDKAALTPANQTQLF